MRCASGADGEIPPRADHSQLIPACGVHLAPTFTVQTSSLLSTHTRVRCASPAWSQSLPPPPTLNSYPRAVCIIEHMPNFDVDDILSTHTRVRCASAKATKMSCVHGFYMHNFYLIECIRKQFIIAESRTFSISGCRVTPADGANPHVLYWALHIRSDHNSL